MSTASLPPVKVIYIAGAGRSGSTILANILGQVQGFFSAGELYHLWLSPPDQRLCGCAKKLSDCEVWGGIFKELFGDEAADRSQYLRWRNAGARTRHIPMLLLAPLRQRLLKQLDDYLKLTERVYRSICTATGSRVVVDSSKVTLYACLLGQLPGIDLRVVHLVRDPRAVAFSFLRKKPHPTLQGVMVTPRYNIVKSALLWNGFNASTELFLTRFSRQYLQVRYEDFADAPQQVVRHILGSCGEGDKQTPFLAEHAVALEQHHTVGGNPDRFRTGRVELSLDDEWETAMIPWQKLAVSALTWPLRLRYRYP